MTFFCSDLDNTLIYSYKHDIGRDKVLVERMAGKELAFMTSKAHNMLIEIANSKVFVPITTRSTKQYYRIDFGKDIPIKYALVANGGILLEDGKVNEKWLAETREIVKEIDEELERGMALLKRDSNVFFEVRKAEDLFVFTKSNDCEKTIQNLKRELDTEKVYIDKNGSKVYIFPKMLDKGSSLKRFKDFIQGDHAFIAAGDSKFDISMLENANVGMCPESLEGITNGNISKFNQQTFTEEMLKCVMEFKSS